ncbi:MAG TPA: hypothetical protein VK968_17475 [Roseimicrobium sp.]|nr:hypothetical protein [Roseimicrobium sp.]
MKTKPVDEAGPETPHPIERRIVLGTGQAVGVAVLLAVPVLALTKALGERVERLEMRQDGWVVNAEVPVCARDGASLQITVQLARADNRPMASAPRVDISSGYLSRFSDVRQCPSVFGVTEESAKTHAAGPVVIELIPDRFGWARGRLGVTTDTGERLELELKTFVFP